MPIDKRLREWASPRQCEIIDAIVEHVTYGRAAKALGIGKRRVEEAVRLAKKRAAAAGYSPQHDMGHTVPEGFHVRGVSTLYGAEGVKLQWVKSQRDAEHRHEVLVEAIRSIAEPFAGTGKAPARVEQTKSADLLPVLVWGDVHLGMLSWGEETGADFDLAIAERTLCAAVDKLVALSPPSDQALIVSVGDLLHYDSMQAKTVHSGHVLDTDTRLPKIVRCAVRMIRWCIERALERHGRVKFVYVPGNHDAVGSVMLSIALSEFYSNEPRVEVDTSPNPFRYHRFGKVLLGMVHGDRTKPQDLPGIMAADRPRDWGETTTRRMLCGHVHHDQVKEFRGCTVETFRTLAPKDAWHNIEGYRSGQDMKCIVFHGEHGEILRHTVGISMLEAA